MKTCDFHWAAGFLEGEGSFLLTGRDPKIQAVQVSMEPLEKLISFFGGYIYEREPRSFGKKLCHVWFIGGGKAASIMMTIYGFMSSKRQMEIRKVLLCWKNRGARSGDRHYMSILSDEEALIGMRRVINGEKMSKVAKDIGISYATFSNWLRGEDRPYLIKWLNHDFHISHKSSYGLVHPKKRMDDTLALTAMRRVVNGKETQYRVAKDMGIAPEVLSRWLRGLLRPYLLAQLQQEEYSVKEAINGR